MWNTWCSYKILFKTEPKPQKKNLPPWEMASNTEILVNTALQQLGEGSDNKMTRNTTSHNPSSRGEAAVPGEGLEPSSDVFLRDKSSSPAPGTWPAPPAPCWACRAGRWRSPHGTGSGGTAAGTASTGSVTEAQGTAAAPVTVSLELLTLFFPLFPPPSATGASEAPHLLGVGGRVALDEVLQLGQVAGQLVALPARHGGAHVTAAGAPPS